MEKDYSQIFPSLRQARKRGRDEVPHHDFVIPEIAEGLGIDKTYLIKTYGCQGNIADSEKIAGIMEQMGFQEAVTRNIATCYFLTLVRFVTMLKKECLVNWDA
jgi:tRNA-2-methylthio-N6-dimethylallyladenosine synthase